MTLAEIPLQGARPHHASQAPQSYDPAAAPAEARPASPAKTKRDLLQSSARAGALVKGITAIGVVAVSLAGTPAGAAAYAAIGPEPEPGSPGLPDGRVYEEVSPSNKSGNEAAQPVDGVAPVMFAAPDGGDSVLYNTSGPIGDSATGVQDWAVAKRAGTTWQSSGVLPRALGEQSRATTNPNALAFSSDLSAAIFEVPESGGIPATYVPNELSFANGHAGEGAPAIFVHSLGTGETKWLGWPMIADPLPDPASTANNFSILAKGGSIAGASPQLNTIYFNFWGTLSLEDDHPNTSLGDVSRAQVLRGETSNPNADPAGDSGFYEWHEGTVRSAGNLPNGTLDPYGAISAATPYESKGFTGDSLDNQVSETGERAFFLSPAPESGSGRPSELYLHETAQGIQRTVLVSRDALLPSTNGEPAPAPTTPLLIEAQDPLSSRSYMYAAPDGSRVFFVSTDTLTAGAPTNNEGKVYEFNIETETLSYLPGLAPSTVAGGAPSRAQIVASSPDGAKLLFEKLVAYGPQTQRPIELDLWADGHVTPIASLNGSVEDYVYFAQITSDGKAFVFQTSDPLPGFNDGGHKVNGELQPTSDVYSYSVGTDTLDCLSCPPRGIAPTGNAELSHAVPTTQIGGSVMNGMAFRDDAVSAEGDQVFFDAPGQLVPQAANGLRNVYEWENGRLFLISTGTSGQASYFGDSNSDGTNVFFATSQGLVPGDTDEGYDVYDASPPEPEHSTTTGAAPCQGEVCHGPPVRAPILGPPASASFSGLGNPSFSVATRSAKPKPASPAQKLAKALIACHKEKRRKKRLSCDKQAHRRYSSRASNGRK